MWKMSLLHTFCRRIASRSSLKEIIYQPSRVCTTGKVNIDLSKFLPKEEEPVTLDYVVADQKRDAINVSWDTSIRYIESQAYKEAYGEDNVWTHYRRNYKGHRIPETRLTCIRKGQIGTASPCPLCRDEYLVVDYRNVRLLQQFLNKFTGELYSTIKTGVCQKRHDELRIEVAKAIDYGFIQTQLDLRHYDMKEYYKLVQQSKRDGKDDPDMLETVKTTNQKEAVSGEKSKKSEDVTSLPKSSDTVTDCLVNQKELKDNEQDSSSLAEELDGRTSDEESGSSSSDSDSSDEELDKTKGTSSDKPVDNKISDLFDKSDNN